MKFEATPLEGLKVIQPNFHEDERGAFGRLFCEREFIELDDFRPVQMNLSINDKAGTLRGMHFQYPPHDEAKCIKCLKGAIFDVVVDIRQDSETFLACFEIELTAENHVMLYIPAGFAHGFQTTQDDTELLYLHSEFYQPGAEGALHYADPMLGINWPLPVSSVSKRDLSHPFLNEEFRGVTQ